MGPDFPVTRGEDRKHPAVTKGVAKITTAWAPQGTDDGALARVCDSPPLSHLALFSHSLFLTFCHCCRLLNYSLTSSQPFESFQPKTLASSGRVICQTLSKLLAEHLRRWTSPTCQMCPQQSAPAFMLNEHLSLIQVPRLLLC